MNKFFVAIAALLAVQAVDAQSSGSDYLPFQNPGDSKCVVKGALNKENDFYALKLGSCTDKNVAKLRHVGKGKELRTSDKYCFDTLKNTNKEGSELVLKKCPAKCETAGVKWTKVGKNQWQNGNKLCIEYNTKSKKFEQRKCATLASDNKTSRQQWVFCKTPSKPTPAPPAPKPEIKCADWGKKWVCASGWVLDTTKGLTCVAATDASCSNVCCRKATTCKSAGLANKCPVDYKFVDRQCGNPGQKPCSWDVCCDYAPVTKTCRNQGYQNACPAGYKFKDIQCGNKGQAACSRDTCCEYVPQVIKCNSWNRCNKNFVLKPRAADIFCTNGKPVEGPGYAPTCSNDICCDPKPVEPEYKPISCGVWNEKFGSCNPGFQLKSSPYNRQCFNPSTGAPAGNTFGMCNNDYCCDVIPSAPAALTCKQWSGKCDKDAGKALVAEPEKVTCPASNPNCNADICCVQDTCENWSKSIVEKTPLEYTGEEVCNRGQEWAGMMPKSDPRFKQACVENGEKVVCKPELCCVMNTMFA